MNWSPHFIVSLVLLFSHLTAAAQEKALTEKEFNSVWKTACEKTSLAPHVETETNEKYGGGTESPYFSYIHLTRYLPPDRVWIIAGSKAGKPEDKYEEIRIGKKSYSRGGTGPWKFQELGFSGLYYCEPEATVNFGKGNGSGSASDSKQNSMEFEHEYRYIGREQLGAESTEIFVHIKRMIVISSGFRTQTTFKYSYWLNNRGRFLKTEFTTRNADSQPWSREVREYNYDQKDLKIEAPTIP